MSQLDEYYQPVDHPLLKKAKELSQDDVLSSLNRNAISPSRMQYITADKIAAGTVIVALNVGSSTTGYIKIDGANKRIVINDGTTDRIYFGYDSGGF